MLEDSFLVMPTAGIYFHFVSLSYIACPWNNMCIILPWDMFVDSFLVMPFHEYCAYKIVSVPVGGVEFFVLFFEFNFS